jgi:predicted MPP superfamily phosphohydrolase
MRSASGALRRLVRRAALLSVALALALALWSFWWEPSHIVTRESTLQLSCWNAPPLRMAIASDLHVGSPNVDLAKLDEMVRRINAGRPDVIVLLGDYVITDIMGGTFVSPEVIASRLGDLRAPLGVYAVLGNHDWWLSGARVSKAFTGAGIHMIDDTATPLDIAGRRFWLVGVSDWIVGRHDIGAAMSRVNDQAPAIALTHNPDVFPLIPRRVCLTLAGHTHGGQVALPFIGRPVVPSDYGERYAIGHVEEAGKHLFVTAGIGTSIIPVRFRVAPEIVFLRVESSAPAVAPRR